MAALRYAARRLGGSVLHRTQAAVASPAVPEGQRLFLPRFNHSNTPNQGSPPKKQLSPAMSEIQQKKEELYDMLSKAEKITYQNCRMMHHLSLQVNPRPKDLKWHGLRMAKWMTTAVDVCAIFTLLIIIESSMVAWFERSFGDGKVDALGVNKQEG